MRRILFALSICLFSAAAFSQGLIFDSAQFASRTSVKITRGPKPRMYSLKKFTPVVYPQVGATCVAHSFATARTILAAKGLGLTDKQKITGMYFSPYYIYYRNKSDEDVNCTNGLNVEQAAQDVLKNGFAPLADVEYPNYYPFTGNPLCMDKGGSSYPPSMQEDQDVASKYKIDEIYTVTTLQQLKTALSSGMPVAVILFPPASFSDVKTALWTPSPTEYLDRNIMAHAVLAIGYDDTKFGGCVEIMNSWGDTWGDKGFTSIKYSDYTKFFVGGYAFYKKDNDPPVHNKIQTTPKKTTAPVNHKAPMHSSVKPVTVKVKTGYQNRITKFNNAEFIKAFEKE